ncbi:MAG TPA: protein translocase subunit SecF, partial [Anaerolineales bacterium]|nr:protein translocase subunit SecF [Anaerolineales bacterium]
MIDIVGRRYLYFAISALVILPGLIALAIWGPPAAAIDFTGGNLLEVRFEASLRPAPAAAVATAERLGIDDTLVQTAGESDLVIRSRPLEADQKAQLLAALETEAGASVTVLRDEHVGPSIGAEVAQRAVGAVALAVLGILGFITYAFRGVPHAARYGVAAILAMLHDVLVVISVQVLLGRFLFWEIDALFLTALLTVIGFSVHDTIVVFDRIRENQRIHRRLSYDVLVNHSIVQTLGRSINTQLTVMLTLLALLLFGGSTTQHFVTILLIGVLSGTYSSIFNAAPILVVWENREWHTWFRR